MNGVVSLRFFDDEQGRLALQLLLFRSGFKEGHVLYYQIIESVGPLFFWNDHLILLFRYV